MVYLQRSLQVINPLSKHLAESVVCCRLLLLPLHLLHHHHRHLFCRSSLSSSAFGIACQHHPGESDNDNRPQACCNVANAASPCPQCAVCSLYDMLPRLVWGVICSASVLLPSLSFLPSRLRLPARSRLTMRMRLVAIHCDSLRCVVCRGWITSRVVCQCQRIIETQTLAVPVEHSSILICRSAMISAAKTWNIIIMCKRQVEENLSKYFRDL